MSIEILQSGLLATIQDLGRFGSQKYGVIVGGAMDPLAVRIGNILVGNEEGEAAIEITMYGTEILFKEDQLIAITGGQLDPHVDGEKLPMWRPVLIRKGQILHFKALRSGCRAYIAIAGGLEVPEVMGSKSTYLRAGIGGYEGRELRTGDILTFGYLTEHSKTLTKQLQEMPSHFTWSVNYSSFYTFKKKETIRILLGAEYERFTKDSQKKLISSPFKLTVNADRMGYQLEGTKLMLKKQFELLSEGVTYGTIQIPSNGQPIILMADCQTTGGYPKIGQVISADLPRLAQLQPGSEIRFQIVTIDEAEDILIEQEKDIHEVKIGIQFKVAG
ncbi:biotin-dependent carboxyltransferase family protein [Pseudogracilibacillus sp. SE30717A]|uniref:5-oxoprolinase subunit C family protein n=1 Tax=Pseudogracilibacillus sp. SE30717A TaxID=3098293 RepID=UPI00300E2E10